MAKESRTVIGYIPKDWDMKTILQVEKDEENEIIQCEIDPIFYKKGNKDYWGEDDYPPRKVTITITIE